ncbi:hypothetical protein O6H91_02G048200 [Diphasiastrum complanatum]|uniref:Uncharacterized protein n=2 Tax=Diphasiastrum complanatum TaxID=34168 RepID=A0ACC2EF45_DIPCM|nr:hypothetical protein O6H91_02G048200 [Diphasiastrum complanatum]KAJ7565109.1 hypothetical protein O6H91_02G048200 [Diphasiastrum complanatum]
MHIEGKTDVSAKMNRLKRQSWTLESYEINGRMLRLQRLEFLYMMLRSYSEIGTFGEKNFSHPTLPSQYGTDDTVLMRHSDIQEVAFTRFSMPSSVVSCVDFDTKGIYLACVTSNGSLSINDYEILYCCSMEGYKVEPVKPIVEISTRQRLEAVRWCPFNLDEVAYVGLRVTRFSFMI